MGCYKCDDEGGTDVVLCQACREKRAKSVKSIAEIVNQKSPQARPHLQILKEEWHVVLGGIIMIFAAINGFMWFFFSKQEKFDPNSWISVDSAGLYDSCMNQLDQVDASSIDYQSLSVAYATELSEYLKSEAASGSGVIDPVKFLVGLRVKQACLAAKDTCSRSPNSADCQSYVSAYMNVEAPAEAPEH